MKWLYRHFPHIGSRAGTAWRVLDLYAANRSPRAWTRLLRHATRPASAGPPPVLFAIGVTYRCVCRCEHCYAHGRARDAASELTTDEVKRLVDQAAELGALEVFFTGGESLLRRDVPELIAHGRSLGLLTRISTNGYLLDRRRVDALAKAGLTQAGISLDYADAEAHDRSRRLPGLHARAVAGVRRLVEAGVKVQAHCVATRPKVTAELERVIALAREIGVSYVCLIFPAAAGRLEGASEDVLTAEERDAVRALQDPPSVFAELATPQALCAAVGRKFLYVNPYGYTSPCTTVRYWMGNVRRTPVGVIWRRYTEGMNMECRGNCALNEPGPHEELRAYLSALEAMEHPAPAVTSELKSVTR